MKPFAPFLLASALAAAALSARADAPAQMASDEAPARKTEPAAAKPSSVEVSGPTSHMSSALSAAITSQLPKYQPPPPPQPSKPAPQDPGLEEAEADGSSTTAADQPRNKIIRLPKYVVEGDRPPVFREKDVYTKKGLAQLAMDRYLSAFDRSFLNRFTLPLLGMSNAARAMMMYEEDQRLQNIADIKEQADTARKSGNKAESEYLLRESDRAFIRSGGMDWTMPAGSDR